MEKNELINGKKPARRTCSRRALILFGTLFSLIIIALAVGLGVGLTRNRNNNNTTTSSNNSNMGNAGSLPTYTPLPGSNNAIWQPPANASWQIILNSTLDITKPLTPDVDVWDVDLFTTPKETIEYLHSKDKKVVCYFSAGTYEPDRPDSTALNATKLGGTLPRWQKEKWLDTGSPVVRDIMAARIKTAADSKCDGIDPDNVDGYSNKENDLGLTSDAAADYVKFLAATASQHNMATGLKNAAKLIPQVLNHTQFSVNEQCEQFSECADFNGYIGAGKPVFHLEYPKGDDTNDNQPVDLKAVGKTCSSQNKASSSYGFSTLIKNIDLDGWGQFCNGDGFASPTNGGGKSSGGDSDTKKAKFFKA